MLRLFIGLSACSSIILADVVNLQLAELDKQAVAILPPNLPELRSNLTNYQAYNGNNIFDAERVDSYATDAFQDYNLNQLKMVGYMKFAGLDYAFVMTPYTTLKLKIGDKIKNGTVTKLSMHSLEIEDVQFSANKTFINKIYLELAQEPPKKLPKLFPK